jgi:hypothetical protein
MSAKPDTLQRDQRYSMPLAVDATARFNYPNPNGQRRTATLLELSASGLSFVAENELPLIVRGAKLEGVVIQVGDTEIEGKLLIKHVTKGESDEVVYGGVFYPATMAGQQELNRIIFRLDDR